MEQKVNSITNNPINCLIKSPSPSPSSSSSPSPSPSPIDNSIIKIPSYPYFQILETVVKNLPNELTNEECYRLATFLNKFKGIIKIEYFELVNLINKTTTEKIYPDNKNNYPDNKNNYPEQTKLLRTMRFYPHFTILKKVSDLPLSLSYTKIRELAEYLDNYLSISSISYNDLNKLMTLSKTNKNKLIEEKKFITKQDVKTEFFDIGQTNNSLNSVNFTKNKKYMLCIKKVENMPNDLDDEEYERLNIYLESHPEIKKIDYHDLLNFVEPRSPKKRFINKNFENI